MVRSRVLTLADVEVDVRDRWQSPKTKARYPSRWHLVIPSEGLDFDIQPYLAEQELDVSVRYWGGAVKVSGTKYGEPVNGSGCVELVGYHRPINE